MSTAEIAALVGGVLVFVLRHWQRLASGSKRREAVLKISEWAWRDTEVWAAQNATHLARLSGATRAVEKLKHFLGRIGEWLVASGQKELGEDEKAGPAVWADIRSNAAKLPAALDALPPAPNLTVLDSGLWVGAARQRPSSPALPAEPLELPPPPPAGKEEPK